MAFGHFKAQAHRHAQQSGRKHQQTERTPWLSCVSDQGLREASPPIVNLIPLWKLNGSAGKPGAGS